MVDFRSVSAPCVSFSEGECPPYIYLREEECRLLSWVSLLLLLFVLDLCYALGEEGVATISSTVEKSVRECPPYIREEEMPIEAGVDVLSNR